MSDYSEQGDEVDSEDGRDVVGVEPADHERVACTEAYEQDGQVVLYDAENPLAWIEATNAVEIERMS